MRMARVCSKAGPLTARVPHPTEQDWTMRSACSARPSCSPSSIRTCSQVCVFSRSVVDAQKFDMDMLIRKTRYFPMQQVGVSLGDAYCSTALQAQVRVWSQVVSFPPWLVYCLGCTAEVAQTSLLTHAVHVLLSGQARRDWPRLRRPPRIRSSIRSRARI